MSKAIRISRRRFISQSALIATCGPLLAASMARGAAASDRIRVGFIGMGKQAGGHLGGFLKMPDVQVLAVCDVETTRRENAQQKVNETYAKQTGQGSYKGCDAYNDFRELLARDDIDALVICTPDHWHAIPAIMAARAGKDIYCEKPLSLFVAEGRAMVNAAREKNIVFQTGSQQRSEFGGRFRRAVELVRNGHLGEIKVIRIGVGGPAVPCDLATEPLPPGTDWNMWLGPAPERGYNEVLCPKGMHNHFPQWRKYREFGGGALADMGAHHFDIAQWALGMDNSGPTRIEPPTGNETTGLKFVYASGVEMIHGGAVACSFEGTKGTLNVDRSKIESTPASIAEHQTTESEPFHCEPSTDHRRNWVEAIRSRNKPICDVEIGHRSATICELGNIGYQLRRPLKWDPVAEQFVGDDEANRLLTRELRSPWTL